MKTNTEDDFKDIRGGVQAICNRFPGEYWRKLDSERAYPSEFVKTLTDNGYLAVLIPEKYGGSGLGLAAAAAILEEIHKSGGNAAACHAQMYIMGTLLRHGSNSQKSEYLPNCLVRYGLKNFPYLVKFEENNIWYRLVKCFFFFQFYSILNKAWVITCTNLSILFFSMGAIRSPNI